MLQKLWYWLSYPVFEDEEKAQVARVVNVLAWTILAVVFLFDLYLAIFQPSQITSLKFYIFIPFLWIGAIKLLLQLRLLRPSTTLLLCGVWVLITLSILSTSGVHAVGYGSYFILVMLAFIMIGRGAMIALGALSILAGLVMVNLELQGKLVPVLAAPTQEWLLQALLMVSVLMILPASTKTVRETLSQVRQELAERKQAQEKTKRQLQQLQALQAISATMTANLEMDRMVETITAQVVQQLRVHAADLWILHPETRMLQLAHCTNTEIPKEGHELSSVQDSLPGRAILEQRLIFIDALQEAGAVPGHFHKHIKDGCEIYAAVPLAAKGEMRGVLEVYDPAGTPDQAWFDYLQTLASQAAIALDSQRLFRNQQEKHRLLKKDHGQLLQSYEATLVSWSRAMELREPGSQAHTQRVTELALKLASRMGMDPASMDNLRRGALLHDIGMAGVPDAILHKPGPLTDEERRVVRKHPEHAFQMISAIEFLSGAVQIPYLHHERWDGSGYPLGLTEEQIPLPARLFAVVDVWDALLSERSYRHAWEEPEARDYLQTWAGSAFDPAVVASFLALIDEEKAKEGAVAAMTPAAPA